MYVKQIVDKDDSYTTNLNQSSFTRILFYKYKFSNIIRYFKIYF